jgi:hypothetical protein
MTAPHSPKTIDEQISPACHLEKTPRQEIEGVVGGWCSAGQSMSKSDFGGSRTTGAFFAVRFDIGFSGGTALRNAIL